MSKAQANSFEEREKKKRKSAITKMSQLMEEKIIETPTEQVLKEKNQDNTVINEKNKDQSITQQSYNIEHYRKNINKNKEKTIEKDEIYTYTQNNNDFFNLNVKNDIFEGKVTTVRVYDDILETLKRYANIKNYPIIEFTNKIITIGLEDISDYGMVQISEIKFKNTTSRSIMYNLTDKIDEKVSEYIESMDKKGYKISRNIILNVILNETLKKFYK